MSCHSGGVPIPFLALQLTTLYLQQDAGSYLTIPQVNFLTSYQENTVTHKKGVKE